MVQVVVEVGQCLASPGRKAGCGLKRCTRRRRCPAAGRITRPKGRVRIETDRNLADGHLKMRITRPKGRVRIETQTCSVCGEIGKASPGRKAGCGLKPAVHVRVADGNHRITRPKGRVRIETAWHRRFGTSRPGITRPKGRVRIETVRLRSNHSRTAGITRPKGRVRIETAKTQPDGNAGGASPGRKAGCGLKQKRPASPPRPQPHHPAERPGAD